jgi:hypothetical protein
MFRTFPLAALGQGQTAAVLPASWAGLGADTINAALFNNSVTPDKDATLANSAYNAGTWLTANEVTDATNWTAGGRALASKTLTNPSTGVFQFDAADTSGAGNVTISNAYGCLIYDATITAGTGGVAKEAVCFNYFGAGQSVTAGTFTIVWNSNGIFQITV